MTVKENVLLFLENNKGEYISGNDIANKLNVSRNAVWKAVNSLKEEGYNIDSIRNKGYSLHENSFILSKQSIDKYLNINDYNMEIFESIDSTNSYLKKKAEEGANEGTIVISEEQTEGRGRMGKTFYSPSKTGVYISILLKPDLHGTKALYITTAAAVAVANAVDEISGKNSKIKWVNDIFLDDKKISGILTEASFDLEGGGINYAVLGIGLNLTMPKGGFPNDIEDIAGSVFSKDNIPYDHKNKIIAKILNNFFRYYENIENKDFLNEYRDKSLILNKSIDIFRGNTIDEGFALDIDDEFRLKVKMKDNGEIKYLSSGEVSVRKK